MRTVNVDFMELPLEVDGIYSEEIRGDNLTQYEPHGFEIHYIRLYGHDVLSLVEQGDNINDLEKLILNTYY